MKKHRKWSGLYLTAVTVLMYLPILLVIVYSFNESKLSSLWAGFSLKWYRQLFRNRAMFEALRNSILLALASSTAAAAVGTLGAYGFARHPMRS